MRIALALLLLIPSLAFAGNPYDGDYLFSATKTYDTCTPGNFSSFRNKDYRILRRGKRLENGRNGFRMKAIRRTLKRAVYMRTKRYSNGCVETTRFVLRGILKDRINLSANFRAVCSNGYRCRAKFSGTATRR